MISARYILIPRLFLCVLFLHGGYQGLCRNIYSISCYLAMVRFIYWSRHAVHRGIREGMRKGSSEGSGRNGWMGWHTFYMPGSYVAFMENPDLEHAEEMNRIARGQLKALIPMIKNEEQLNSFKVTGAGRFMSFAANLFFYRYIIARDGFYATERCIGCGKCSVVCPLNNIDIVNRKPQWGSVCTHCMACVHQCPERAVEFRKISVGKNRYYNQGK